jgi:hypothetical protein
MNDGMLEGWHVETQISFSLPAADDAWRRASPHSLLPQRLLQTALALKRRLTADELMVGLPKALGLTVPPSLLARADEVIE